MLYFFILPVYLVCLALLSIVSIIFIFRPSLKHIGIYGLGVSIGSIPGFILANVLLWLVTLSLLHFQIPDWLQTFHKFLLAGMAFLGPLPVSLAGIIAGSITGVFIVYRIRNSSVKVSKKE